MYVQESSTSCHFEFQWKTHHACPTYGKYNKTTGVKLQESTCKVLDKNTNQRLNLYILFYVCFLVNNFQQTTHFSFCLFSIDLNSLKNKTWIIAAPPPPGMKSLLFYMTICNKLPRMGHAYCGVNAGEILAGLLFLIIQ